MCIHLRWLTSKLRKTFTISAQRSIAGFPAIVFLFSGITALAHAQTQFSDVSNAAGVAQATESYGASWGDINGDGYLDLFASNHRNRPSLYVNQGNGRFNDMASEITPWVIFPNRDTHGGAFADYDNDGDQDLVVSAGTGNPTQFYVNNNGNLVEKAVQLGVDFKKLGGRLPVWMDYDGDNLLDFVMTQFGGVAKLFTQTATAFIENTTSAGLLCGRFQYGQLYDVDNDGRLDFVCPDEPIFPQKIYDTEPARWINRAGLFPRVEHVADSIAGDFNNDQRMDMFLISNALVRPSSVALANNKTIEARFVGGQKGFNFVSDGAITVDLFWKILDNGGISRIKIGSTGFVPSSVPFTLDPGDPDVAGLPAPANPGTGPLMRIGYDPATKRWTVIYQTDSSSPSPEAYFIVTTVNSVANLKATGLWTGDKPGRPTLIMNNASGYTDNTVAAGLGDSVQCVSATVGDFDNDRDLDLYLACRTGVSNLENLYYDNQGDGSFLPVSNAGGAAGAVGSNITSGAGVAETVISADYDVDGFLDLFVTNGLNLRPKFVGGPNKLFRNQGNANHWIELDLTATGSSRDPVGARVTAKTGSVTQLRVFGSGYHRWSQEPNRMHFGLGSSKTVDLTVEWPSGNTEVYPGVSADELYRITEGSGIVVVTPGDVPPPGNGPPACGEPNFDPATESGVFIWKDCNSGQWQTRVTAGGGTKGLTYTGSVVSSATFSAVTPFSVESSDILDSTTNPLKIAYQLKTYRPGVDGFDFLPAAGSTLCFELDGPAGATVFVGANRTVATPPFDMETLDACGGGGVPPGDECYAPSYDAGTEANVFLWKGCDGSGLWHVRATAGGSSSVIKYEGAVTADQAFSGVTPFSIETADVLDNTSDPLRIGYLLKMIRTGEDGFSFSFPAGANACFDATAIPAGAQVLLGQNRVPVTLPLALETLQSCQAAPPPGADTCGAPDYDSSVDDGLFVWKDCGADNWHVLAMAGSGYKRYVGNITASQDFTNVTPVSVESNDVFGNTPATAIDFEFGVAPPWFDGVDFSIPCAATVSFNLTGPAGADVHVGSSGTVVPVPFNLTDFGSCGGG